MTRLDLLMGVGGSGSEGASGRIVTCGASCASRIPDVPIRPSVLFMLIVWVFLAAWARGMTYLLRGSVRMNQELHLSRQTRNVFIIAFSRASWAVSMVELNSSL